MAVVARDAVGDLVAGSVQRKTAVTRAIGDAGAGIAAANVALQAVEVRVGPTNRTPTSIPCSVALANTLFATPLGARR